MDLFAEFFRNCCPNVNEPELEARLKEENTFILDQNQANDRLPNERGLSDEFIPDLRRMESESCKTPRFGEQSAKASSKPSETARNLALSHRTREPGIPEGQKRLEPRAVPISINKKKEKPRPRGERKGTPSLDLIRFGSSGEVFKNQEIKREVRKAKVEEKINEAIKKYDRDFDPLNQKTRQVRTICSELLNKTFLHNGLVNPGCKVRLPGEGSLRRRFYETYN